LPMFVHDIIDFLDAIGTSYKFKTPNIDMVFQNVVKKFKTKHSEGDIKKYYSKFDVGVEVTLYLML